MFADNIILLNNRSISIISINYFQYGNLAFKFDPDVNLLTYKHSNLYYLFLVIFHVHSA